jgi:inward rectifier potassium channel
VNSPTRSFAPPPAPPVQVISVPQTSPSGPVAYEVRIIGAPSTPLRDFYHGLMQLNWPKTIVFISFFYFVVNVVFAVAYFECDGIEHADPHSFLDAFYFSVQTMGTIGYGFMYPASPGANVLVVVESTTGLVLTALATGLVFAKFSRPTARIMFSERATISPVNGVPTFSFRLGNRRKNRIVEAQIRLVMLRTERTAEGKDFYRTTDLKLTRNRLSLARSWQVMHVIDETSPLYKDTPDTLEEEGVEFLISVSGMDDTWMQTVHAQHRYSAQQVVWGHRLVDVLEEKGTVITLDLNKFHHLEPTPPLPTFPYPRS